MICQMCKDAVSKFSKCEPHHEHKQELQDIACTNPTVLKSFVQHVATCFSLDNSDMVMLSMEPRKQIIILHNK